MRLKGQSSAPVFTRLARVCSGTKKFSGAQLAHLSRHGQSPTLRSTEPRVETEDPAFETADVPCAPFSHTSRLGCCSASSGEKKTCTLKRAVACLATQPWAPERCTPPENLQKWASSIRKDKVQKCKHAKCTDQRTHATHAQSVSPRMSC